MAVNFFVVNSVNLHLSVLHCMEINRVSEGDVGLEAREFVGFVCGVWRMGKGKTNREMHKGKSHPPEAKQLSRTDTDPP